MGARGAGAPADSLEGRRSPDTTGGPAAAVRRWERKATGAEEEVPVEATGPEATTRGRTDSAPRGAADPDRRWLRGATALALAAVVALGCAVVTGLHWNDGRSSDAARDDALASARNMATTLTTVNFRSAQDNVTQILDLSTGNFEELFKSNAEPYVENLQGGQVVSAGTVTEAAVKDSDMDSGTAHVLLAVRTNVKSTANPTGGQTFYRLLEEMQYVDGRWLAADVEFLQ